MSCPLTLPSQRVAAETGGHSLRALGVYGLGLGFGGFGAQRFEGP